MALIERFKVDVSDNLDSLTKRLNHFEKKVLPKTIHDTTRFLVFDLKDLQQKEMKRVFDRPVRWTINSIKVRYTPASQRDQFGEVFFAENPGKGTPAYKYLSPHIFGGKGGQKRHEVALTKRGILPAGGGTAPGRDVRLNKSGNITAAQYVKILSQLGASGEQGYLANQTARSKARAGTRRTQFYVARKGGKAVGVRERTGKKTSKKILNFTDTRKTHPKRYDFYGISERFVRQESPKKFVKALRRNVARMKGK
jgi:hypothetical protein